MVEEMLDNPKLKDCVADIRDNMCITVSDEKTFVIVLAVHKNDSRNDLTKIISRKSFPLGGYVYDSTSDSYHVPCVDYMQLGYLPVSFVMRMPGTGTWRCRVPMPEATIQKYLTNQQRHDLSAFKSVYKGDDYFFIFMQVLDAMG